MKQILSLNKFKVICCKDYFKEYDDLIDSSEKWIQKASKSDINAEELFVELKKADGDLALVPEELQKEISLRAVKTAFSVKTELGPREFTTKIE